MTFASYRQIVILIVLTAGLLFGIDRLKTPRPEVVGAPERSSPATDRPTIRVWLNELSCSACLGGARKALSEVRWLEGSKVRDALPGPLEPDQTAGVVDQHWRQVVMEMQIPDENIARIDFVAVLDALRRAGFTPTQMEFSGVPHYRLEADLGPICSPDCVEGTREAMDALVRASKPKGWFRWLDSYRVDGVNDSLVIYPRIGATVDVMEILGAINTIGFEASALTVEVHGAR